MCAFAHSSWNLHISRVFLGVSDEKGSFAFTVSDVWLSKTCLMVFVTSLQHQQWLNIQIQIVSMYISPIRFCKQMSSSYLVKKNPETRWRFYNYFRKLPIDQLFQSRSSHINKDGIWFSENAINFSMGNIMWEKYEKVGGFRLPRKRTFLWGDRAKKRESLTQVVCHMKKKGNGGKCQGDNIPFPS